MNFETYRKETVKHLGEKLRKLRKDRGLRLIVAYHISEAYGIKLCPSQLGRMELGQVELPLRTLLALADYYAVTPGWLLEGEEPK